MPSSNIDIEAAFAQTATNTGGATLMDAGKSKTQVQTPTSKNENKPNKPKTTAFAEA